MTQPHTYAETGGPATYPAGETPLVPEALRLAAIRGEIWKIAPNLSARVIDEASRTILELAHARMLTA